MRRDDVTQADNLVAEALLIADRVETLVGIWAIGLKPTGEKDPFALRRHALGLIRSFELCAATAAAKGLPFTLRLPALLAFAAASFDQIDIPATVLADIQGFVFDRYQNQLAPEYGVQAVAAVIANDPPLHEVVQRTQAVVEFQKLPEAESLAAANKRVGNILKKAEGTLQPQADEALLQEAAERALQQTLNTVKPVADAAFMRGDYTASLQALAALKTPVDDFFDHVMVNAEDPALRANRLALLSQLHGDMNRVADLARLAG